MGIDDQCQPKTQTGNIYRTLLNIDTEDVVLNDFSLRSSRVEVAVRFRMRMQIMY